MRYKGKLIKWNSEKALGFIQLDGGSANDATLLGEKLKDEKAVLQKVLKQAPKKIVNYQFTCHVCF